jgi:uncharacterized protein YndB with AHSA1/START domain
MNKATFKTEGTKLYVERMFNAPRSKVWKAWTDAEMLEQWWGPKPYKAVTKEFDFKEGGHWLYNMMGPKGEAQYCWMGYKTIDPENRLTANDAFCDENGNFAPDMPVMEWEITFEDLGDTTMMREVTTFTSKEDMDKILGMGMEAGFSQGLDQLEEVLAE